MTRNLPRRSGRIALFTGLAALLLCSCTNVGGQNSAYSSSVTGSEIVAEALTGAAAASEGGAGVALSAPRPWASSLAGLFVPDAMASGTCPTLASLATVCGGSPSSVSYESCNPAGDPDVTWNGGQSLSCSCSSSCDVTRQITDGSTRVNAIGQTVTFKTTSATDYENGIFTNPGEAIVTCTSETDCSTSRSLLMTGNEYVGSYDGTTIFDFTVYASDVTITGTGAARDVYGGTITVYHNLMDSTGTVRFITELSYTSGCCHPTGGTIITSYQGGTYDGESETLTFGPGCGTATLTDVNGEMSTVSLNQCL